MQTHLKGETYRHTDPVPRAIETYHDGWCYIPTTNKAKGFQRSQAVFFMIHIEQCFGLDIELLARSKSGGSFWVAEEVPIKQRACDNRIDGCST
jgi:hypothetical protein